MVSSHAGNVQNTREQGWVLVTSAADTSSYLGGGFTLAPCDLSSLVPSFLGEAATSLGACVEDFPFAAAAAVPVAEPLLLASVFQRAARVPAYSLSCCRVICSPCAGDQSVKPATEGAIGRARVCR